MSDWETVEGQHWADNADRYTRMLAPYGAAILEAAGPQPADRVLDIGCGCGDLALAIGRAVGPAGGVLGVDLSPAEVEVARRRAADHGLDHLTFAAADATRHRPDQAGFDRAVSRFGVMFFPQPVAAFAHLRTLLRSGAPLVFTCWQELLVNEWLVVPSVAATEVLPLPSGAETGVPGPFSLADPGAIGDVLRGSGFRDVSIDELRAPLWLGSDAADAARFLRSTGLGRAVFAEADEELTALALDHVAAALRPHESDDGVRLAGAAWLVTARA